MHLSQQNPTVRPSTTAVNPASTGCSETGHFVFTTETAVTAAAGATGAGTGAPSTFFSTGFASAGLTSAGFTSTAFFSAGFASAGFTSAGFFSSTFFSTAAGAGAGKSNLIFAAYFAGSFLKATGHLSQQNPTSFPSCVSTFGSTTGLPLTGHTLFNGLAADAVALAAVGAAAGFVSLTGSGGFTT